MLRKSFVSISFATPSKIQVVKLTSSKKNVQKHFSVDLPEGLIVDLKVADEEALGKILKEIWRKVGLHEKSVGIVIPESSTYTKLLTLPKLQSAELDEAISWQAYEYLPRKKEDLILDWKIISEGDEETKILVVAVLKEVLEGYVRSANLAGLYPLVVETPSLSLVRFSDAKEIGSLFIHESPGQTIIIISQGQSIVASSSLKTNEQDEVLKVSHQMIHHYREVSVEQVIVGGPNITSELVDKLKQSLGKEPVFIKQVVSGIDTNLFQEYIIPISLQMKDPTEPADDTTVNLLPLELVKKYEREKMKHQLWSLSLFVSLIVWISFFTTLGVSLYLGMQITSVKGEDVLQHIPPEKAQYISQVEEINKISTKVLTIANAQVYPETIINEISDAKPDGVIILRYRINVETGTIELIGNSSNRQLLIDFKDRLEENVDFSLVHIPISSFEKESNLDYVADFNYLPIAGLKAK